MQKVNGSNEQHLNDYPAAKNSALHHNKPGIIPVIKNQHYKNNNAQQAVRDKKYDSGNQIIFKGRMFQPIHGQLNAAAIRMCNKVPPAVNGTNAIE
jgi:hypothetical protein